MTMTYGGKPLIQPLRSATIDLDLDMTEAGVESLLGHNPPREVIVTLQPGQRWPDDVKRGRNVTLQIMDRTLRGNVRYRRMHRLVIDGWFV